MGTVRRFVSIAATLAVTAGAAAALSTPASAIVGGDPANAAPPWVVLVDYAAGRPDAARCTGSLVAQEWVLTSARCTAVQSTAAVPTLDVVRDPSLFQLTVGALQAPGSGSTVGTAVAATTTTVAAGAAALPITVAVDRIERAPAAWNPAIGQWENDLALLHVAGSPVWPAGVVPLPLAPDAAAWAPGEAVFGWGFEGDALSTTKAGDWSVATTCASTLNTCLTPSATATSSSGAADQGGPWTRLAQGSWIVGGVNSGAAPADPAATADTAPATAAPAATWAASTIGNAAWIRQITGLPDVPRGTVVVETGTFSSWLIGADGFRQRIPDRTVYACLEGNGVASRQLTTFDIGSIPLATTAVAACTPVPRATEPPASTAPAVPAASVLTMPGDLCATMVPVGGGVEVSPASARLRAPIGTGGGGATATLMAIARGNLDGRSGDDFLVHVHCSGGGTGSSNELHAFARNGRYLGMAPYGSQVSSRPRFASGGDREGINAIRVRSNRITVTYMAGADSDPLCCPSLTVTDVIGGSGSGFALISRTVGGGGPATTVAYRCPVGGVDELVLNLTAPPCDSVRTMQQWLRTLGYSIAADGRFGPATQAAVRNFQGAEGLAVDGRCGPLTWAALRAAVGA